MSHTHLERTLALAGLYQALHCVIEIARHGAAEPQAMQPSVYSLLQVDAATVESVFGEPGAVAGGLRQLVSQLTGQPQRNLELTRYALQVLKLERALVKRPDLLDILSTGICATASVCTPFELRDPAVWTHFAELYSRTLSQLKPRLLIHGDSQHLRNTANQQRIRTLLLAAVRAARLWRQVGGSRWQMVFNNQVTLTAAQQYLAQLDASH
ncbi:high frequency lysogenization protein [Allochromatium warmingii]|uniref:High frequency lysogenization protein HflD homolog n=1 Tax=Allochromatium warmingii TaxID=61595 RepID=A0A1H3EYE9_ALLWA|nr:high frequency lysogenization protein HflD [Allochromatium warmingii]SDX83567.1 high frequency lysogenization protein [Allochromatium warmingii]